MNRTRIKWMMATLIVAGVAAACLGVYGFAEQPEESNERRVVHQEVNHSAEEMERLRREQLAGLEAEEQRRKAQFATLEAMEQQRKAANADAERLERLVLEARNGN